MRHIRNMEWQRFTIRAKGYGMAKLNDDIVCGLVEGFRQGDGINLDDLDLALGAYLLHNFAFGDGNRVEVPVELLELCRHVVLERQGKVAKRNGRQTKSRRARAAILWAAADELRKDNYKEEAAIVVLCEQHGVRRTTARNALRDAQSEILPAMSEYISQKTP
jgi:hypothetical protein